MQEIKDGPCKPIHNRKYVESVRKPLRQISQSSWQSSAVYSSQRNICGCNPTLQTLHEFLPRHRHNGFHYSKASTTMEQILNTITQPSMTTPGSTWMVHKFLKHSNFITKKFTHFKKYRCIPWSYVSAVKCYVTGL